MPEQVDFFQVLPRGPGKCVIRGAAFGLPDDRREMRLVRWLGNRINMQVNKEDRLLCERLQRGLADSAYRPGPLSTARDLDDRIPRSAARAHPGGESCRRLPRASPRASFGRWTRRAGPQVRCARPR